MPTGDVRKPNQTLLDLRFGRRFQGAGGLSLEPLLEVYNVLNENASVAEVETGRAGARPHLPKHRRAAGAIQPEGEFLMRSHIAVTPGCQRSEEDVA